MKLGIVFPQDLTEAAQVRDFAQAIEELGFDHIVFPDHVIGGNPRSHTILGPYTHESFFHEPMVAMGYVAAVTQRVELVPGVIILPQRQTALFAKQAAQVDLLSQGRLRLGIGVGWNKVEFDVLGTEFHDRGKRLEEQIAVLRTLWSDVAVDFEGRWHQIRDAGINPVPARRSIPIWFGGWSDPVVDRLARIGDGWLLYIGLDPVGRERLDALWRRCDAVGRDRREIGIQSWIFLNRSKVMAGANQAAGAHEVRSPAEWAAEARAWKAAGATHMDCWTMYGNLTTVDQHVALARQFKAVIDDLG